MPYELRSTARRSLRMTGLFALFLTVAASPHLQTLAQVAPSAKPSQKNASINHGESSQAESRHPLDPLDPDEIRAAVETLRKQKQLAASFRFVTVMLNEPAKAMILHPRRTHLRPREAFIVLLDNATGTGYEAVVNLTSRSVVRFDPLPSGVQPSITLDEFVECEEAARKSPAFQAAMKKRGIDDLSLVMVDAWSAGHYGNEPAEDQGKRLVRALSWVRSSPMDNGYARPIEGLVTVIDLNRKEVVRVEDFGVVPLPRQTRKLGPRLGRAHQNRPQAAECDSRPMVRASPSTAAKCAGRSGRCASASTRARASSSTPSPTMAARSCTAARSPR